MAAKVELDTSAEEGAVVTIALRTEIVSSEFEDITTLDKRSKANDFVRVASANDATNCGFIISKANIDFGSLCVRALGVEKLGNFANDALVSAPELGEVLEARREARADAAGEREEGGRECVATAGGAEVAAPREEPGAEEGGWRDVVECLDAFGFKAKRECFVGSTAA